jgi:hypothetical protein
MKTARQMRSELRHVLQMLLAAQKHIEPDTFAGLRVVEALALVRGCLAPARVTPGYDADPHGSPQPAEAADRCKACGGSGVRYDDRMNSYSCACVLDGTPCWCDPLVVPALITPNGVVSANDFRINTHADLRAALRESEARQDDGSPRTPPEAPPGECGPGV